MFSGLSHPGVDGGHATEVCIRTERRTRPRRAYPAIAFFFGETLKTSISGSLWALCPYTRSMIFPPEVMQALHAKMALMPSVSVFLLRTKEHDRASRLSPPGYERNHCGGRVFWAGAFPRGLGGRRTN